jgi:hypothetical protein
MIHYALGALTNPDVGTPRCFHEYFHEQIAVIQQTSRRSVEATTAAGKIVGDIASLAESEQATSRNLL